MLAGQSLERINSDNSRNATAGRLRARLRLPWRRQGASGLSAESTMRQAVLYPRDRYRLTT
jgi:hypothetical protein